MVEMVKDSDLRKDRARLLGHCFLASNNCVAHMLGSTSPRLSLAFYLKRENSSAH